ncbi:MAG: hypothetical protein AB7S26_07330 [Sandaracinaceae bacterium]
MTREQALAELRKKSKRYLLGFYLGIPMTPVAVLLLQGLAALVKPGLVNEWTDLLPGQLFWTPVTWVAIVISTTLLYLRASKIQKRIAPVIEQGTEVQGTIASARSSQRQARGVTMLALEVTMQTEDGRTLTAKAEEPVGTPLPNAGVGMRAVAWVAPPSVVVAAGGGLLEGSVA